MHPTEATPRSSASRTHRPVRECPPPSAFSLVGDHRTAYDDIVGRSSRDRRDVLIDSVGQASEDERRGRRTAPVMADVAVVAGVSHMTVSRVLNDPGSVKPATR